MDTINFSHETSIGPKFMAISNADLAAMATNFAYRMDKQGAVRIIGNKTGQAMTAVVSLPGHSQALSDSTVFPRLYIHNDNRGGKALRITVGLFRLVCSNGLAVGMPGYTFDQRINHTWSPRIQERVLDLPLVAERALDFIATDLFEQISVAKDTRILDPVSIMGNLPIGSRAKDTAINSFLLGQVRAEDNVQSAWGLYNHVNEAVRRHSRSEFTALAKDEGLLGDIIALSAA